MAIRDGSNRYLWDAPGGGQFLDPYWSDPNNRNHGGPQAHEQVETWFSVLTRQAIRRGSFGSVKAPVAMIDTFTVNWNAGSTPFVWTKTADEILARAVRKDRAINESRPWGQRRSASPHRCTARVGRSGCGHEHRPGTAVRATTGFNRPRPCRG
jgi:hypothetical protein